MSRAAFLPTPADPFLINYWFKFFDGDGWGKYVDKLYVYVNAPTEEATFQFISKILDSHPKVTWLYNPNQTDHGVALLELLKLCTEDDVLLIEDDGFVFKPEMVDDCFRSLESGDFDIVGSKRGSCHEEINTATRMFFNIREDSGEGDHGSNFWPNFLFTHRQLLELTDGNFCGKAWMRGEIIEPIHYMIQDEIAHSDTLVWASIQLRALTKESRIRYVPQYHGHPDDPQFFLQETGLFDGRAPWTHVGSLSSGVCGVLRDDRNRPLAYRTVKDPEDHTILPPEWCQSEMEHGEWERRVCFWEMFYDYFQQTNHEDEASPMIEFAELYRVALNQIIRQYGLSRKSIDNRKRIYRGLGL